MIPDKYEKSGEERIARERSGYDRLGLQHSCLTHMIESVEAYLNENTIGDGGVTTKGIQQSKIKKPKLTD